MGVRISRHDGRAVAMKTIFSKHPTVPMVLASRIIDMIEESGAAQTEVYLALGIVQAVLPALDIPAIENGVISRNPSLP